MEIIELQTIDDTEISQNFKLFLAMNLILYSRKTAWQTSYVIFFFLSKKGQNQVRLFILTDLSFPHVSVILYEMVLFYATDKLILKMLNKKKVLWFFFKYKIR